MFYHLINHRRKWFGLALILLIGTGFWFKHHKKPGMIAQTAVSVEVERVQQANFPIEIHAIGSLSAAHNIEITPEVPGKVAKVFFQDGTFVKQGASLIQLDDAVYQAKLESAKASLIYSQMDYDRKRLLGKQGAISQQAIDQALADLKEKRALAEESQVAVNKMLLTAPF